MRCNTASFRCNSSPFLIVSMPCISVPYPLLAALCRVFAYPGYTLLIPRPVDASPRNTKSA
jgi:hypothetical protein